MAAAVTRTNAASYYGLVIKDARGNCKAYLPRDEKPFSTKHVAYTAYVMFISLGNSTIKPGEKAGIGCFNSEVGYSIEQVSRLEPIAKIRCDAGRFPTQKNYTFEALTPEESCMSAVDLVNSFWQAYLIAVKKA